MIFSRGNFKVLLVVGFAVFFWGLWQWTPLRDYTNSAAFEPFAKFVQARPEAPFLVVGIYVVASLVIFPITAVLVFSALVLSPWQIVLSSGLGVALSGLTGFYAGRVLGKEKVIKLFGQRIERVDSFISYNGVFSVAMIRNVPIAPFSIVNVALGTSSVSTLQFVSGNLLGLSPSIILAAIFGYKIQEIYESPSIEHVVLLVGLSILWVSLAFGANHLIQKCRWCSGDGQSALKKRAD